MTTSSASFGVSSCASAVRTSLWTSTDFVTSTSTSTSCRGPCCPCGACGCFLKTRRRQTCGSCRRTCPCCATGPAGRTLRPSLRRRCCWPPETGIGTTWPWRPPRPRRTLWWRRPRSCPRGCRSSRRCSRCTCSGSSRFFSCFFFSFFLSVFLAAAAAAFLLLRRPDSLNLECPTQRVLPVTKIPIWIAGLFAMFTQ